MAEREYWSLATLLEDLDKGIKELRKELNPYLDNEKVSDFLASKEKDWHNFQQYVANYYLGCPMKTLVNSLRSRGIDRRFYGGMTHRGREYFSVTKEIEEIIMDIEIREYYESIEEEKETKNVNNPDYAIPDELTTEEYDEMYMDEE